MMDRCPECDMRVLRGDDGLLYYDRHAPLPVEPWLRDRHVPGGCQCKANQISRLRHRIAELEAAQPTYGQ